MVKTDVKATAKTVGTAAAGAVVGILIFEVLKIATTKITTLFTKKPVVTTETTADSQSA